MLTYRERYIDHCEPFDETIARSRRLKLFQASGLVELLDDSARYILVRISRETRDHSSSWTDGKTEFVLTESYLTNSVGMQDLTLCCIRIHDNVAPYGGCYSKEIDAAPWTTSLLFTSRENSKALGKISGRLKEISKIAPRWNEL